ncbi:phosphoserine phosphatase SerB [Corynebacterium sp. HMSC04H06]|uniref:phosphoserine phosphatase SerB n=1 Tax=Corynebacterium sp. HMSC04H06 TaxID=1581050 RepID=UPI0008A41633|nr:phosphoserine phosphatase SerB [Corynebacterium sp. HMSC04H06]OFS19034.1 phosphoserine phosphatase [Corynebacterium sp. HMSC04H06]
MKAVDNQALKDVVITTSGLDKPGVSAAFFRVLAAVGVELVDVEQAIFSGRITLAAYGRLDPHLVEKAEAGLRNTLSIYQHTVSVEVGTGRTPRPRSTHVVVIMGATVSAEQMAALAQELANFDTNIDRIRGLSQQPLTGLELDVTVGGDACALRARLAELAGRLGIDLAIEEAGLHRRAKRLVCFDCDSTLIKGEVIEMLAARAGREAEVAAVTERAMRGELDFAESLRERVKALGGLDESVLAEVAEDIELTPGARTTVATLKRLGFKVAVVSGGFTKVLEPLARKLYLDYVWANTLEVRDGKLTGEVTGKIVDRAAKAEYLREFAADCSVPMSQTVAVGDGANDIDMLSAAGLGIAFNAKPALKEVADAQVNHPYLDEVLQLLGIPSTEIEED